MKNLYVKGLTALAVTTSLTAMSTPAFAQLDEIIVTAQKKSENLQDVPIAIQAFDLKALENNRIEGIEDLGTFTPGVYVTPNPADPAGVRVNIRGIGTFDPQIGQDSRVAIYQDGVYLGKTQGLAFDLPDLARVEVLKGPQGTLYGRNTVAGAINLISATPDPSEFSGKFNAEYGNFDHKKVSGAVNVPMGGSAAFRLSGSFMDRGGWVENNGPGVDFGGETKYGLRAAAGFDVGPNFNLEFAGDYNRTEKEPLFYQSVAGFGGPGLFGPAIPESVGRADETTTSFTNETTNLTTQGVSITGRWDINENHDAKFVAAYREADSVRFQPLIPDANPAVVNAITGGFNQALGALPFAFGAAGQPLRSDFSTQFDGSVPDRGLFLSNPGGASNLDNHQQLSLEATFNGDFADGKLEYTAGGFYYDESTGTPQGQNFTNANDYLFVLAQFNPQVTAPNIRNFIGSLDAASGAAPVRVPFPAGADGPVPAAGILLGVLGGQFNPGTPGFSPFAAFPLVNQLVGDGTTCQQTGMAPMAANNFCIPTLSVGLGAARATTNNSLRIDTTAFAIYGQATYHVSDDFRITAGLRYSDESKDGVGQPVSAFFNDNIDLTGNVIAPNVSSFDDNVLDPSLTLEWDATEDVLLYASYKESFRSGGFNSTASAPRLPGETFGADFNFGSESITAYEAGFKGDFGNRVRLNVSGFFYDFKDKQNTLGTNPLIATERVVVNVDDEIYGVEFEGQFAFTDEITAAASYSYIDGDAGEITNPLTGLIDPSSRSELQGTPKNSYLLSLNYDGNNGVFGNVSYSYKDDVLAIPANDLRLPSVSLVNGRIGYKFDMASGNEATIAIWATNLLDEEYLIDSLPFETFAYRTEVYGQPRSYGATLGIKF